MLTLRSAAKNPGIVRSLLTRAVAAAALLAVSCGSPDGGSEAGTPTSNPASAISPTRIPADQAPLTGTYWEYEGTGPANSTVRTHYRVTGAIILQGAPVYVIGSLMEHDGDLSDADVSFVGLNDFVPYGPDGQPVRNGQEELPEGVSVSGGEAESVTVQAGTFQAIRRTVSGPDVQATAWTSEGFVKAIKSEVIRDGNTYAEELISTGKLPAAQVENDFYNSLIELQESEETGSRVSALQALSSFALFSKRSEILDLLEAATSDPEASVRNTAEKAIELINGGALTWRSPAQSVPSGRVPGVAAPSHAGPLLLGISMGTLADALGILGAGASVVGGAAASGSDTAVVILHPTGCERGSIPISLDVGDVVANVPFEVNYNLGWARDIGWWDPANLFTLLLPIGGNIVHTYKYELTLKTSGGNASMNPVVGGDGFHLKLTNVPDLFFAHRWLDQDGPTEDDVIIEASTWMVNRGSHERAHWWSAAESACQLHFSVFNPFYSLPDDFRPSDKNHVHHNMLEHRADFKLQKRPKSSQFPPPPQGWVIESLEQQSQGQWGYDWKLLCATAPSIPLQNCQEHAGADSTPGTSLVTPAALAQGSVPLSRNSIVPVSATYSMEGIPHIHHAAGNPPYCSLANNPGFHTEILDCDVPTELKVSAHGANRLGQWKADNLLQGSSIRDRRLPIAKSFVDHDGAAVVTPTSGTGVMTPTPTASPTATATPTGPLEPASIKPIKAVFHDALQSTDYLVEITGTSSNQPYTYKWSGPDCGDFTTFTTGTVKEANGAIQVTWKHPHPPCDPTKSHSHVTIKLVIEDAVFRYTCEYQGAASGNGPPCEVQKK